MHFGSVLLPQLLEFRKRIEGSGCPFFEHVKLIREEDSLKIDPTSAITADDYKKLDEHRSEIMRMLNSLEGFAIPFAAGVADDTVGFVECGRGFVAEFEQFFGLYSRYELKHYYASTQLLYWRWRNRIKSDDHRRMCLQAGREFFTLTEALIRGESNSKSSRFMASLLRRITKELPDQGQKKF